MTSSELLLLDWKRRIFELYAEIRRTGEPSHAWERWKAERDELFATHPQSPIPPPERARFSRLPYFPYDPARRVVALVEPAAPEHYDIQTSGEAGGSYGFTRFAVAVFELEDQPLNLELYWLDGYGGGLFLPFRDATSGKETYGAGRYLLDTVKGSDLGMDGDRLVLDFNFAYNPSCAYDPKWVCPLAPLPNRLKVP
ncbi:MAG: DUF1684 domain-containing protein, partial [Actinomycetota bacterium]|nr:DUF1684 domain-containing protein [Actinomycetota bacterium]